MKINNIQIEVVKADISRIKGALKIKAVKSCGEIKIRNFYRNALHKAAHQKTDSVVLEASGSKLKEFSQKAVAKILAQEIFRHIHKESTVLKKIIVCAPDKQAYAVFKQYGLGYLDYIGNKLKSPFLTVDAIIEIEGGIVIIKRSNPPLGWALPGGFVDYGESLEEAVVREAKEETGLDITGVRQFHTYSDPDRDPRFHTVGTVFIARASGKPQAGDDAAGLQVVKLSQIKAREFVFDHKKIIQDYISFRATAFPRRPRRG